MQLLMWVFRPNSEGASLALVCKDSSKRSQDLCSPMTRNHVVKDRVNEVHSFKPYSIASRWALEPLYPPPLFFFLFFFLERSSLSPFLRNIILFPCNELSPVLLGEDGGI